MTPCNGFKIKGDLSTELANFQNARIQGFLPGVPGPTARKQL